MMTDKLSKPMTGAAETKRRKEGIAGNASRYMLKLIEAAAAIGLLTRGK